MSGSVVTANMPINDFTVLSRLDLELGPTSTVTSSGRTQVVLHDVLARLGVRLGLEQFNGAGFPVGANLLHLAALVGVEFLGHAKPDLPAAPNGLRHVAHVNEGLHVEALLDQLDRLPGDVADHLLRVLRAAQDLAHVLVCELEQRGQGLGDLGGLGVGDGTGGHLLAVGVRDGVDQQVGIALDVVLGPHHLMACHLLGGENGLRDAGIGAQLSQFRELHVLEPLGVLRQPDVAHAALDGIHEPALPVGRNDRDLVPRDQAAVLQGLPAAEDVLVNHAGLDALAPDFPPPRGLQPVQ